MGLVDDLLAHATDQLPPDEEAAVVTRAQGGDPQARARAAATCYRALCHLAVASARATGRDVEDLAAAGAVALLRCIDSWRPDAGTRLVTWAWRAMSDAIREEAARTGRVLTTSRWTASRRAAVWAAHDALTHELGREPTRREVAERLGWPEHIVDQLVNAGRVESLDRVLYEDGEHGVTPRQLVSGDDTAEAGARLELAQQLAARLQTLTLRQRMVVAAIYGLGGEEPRTTEQLAAELGVTRQAIQDVLARALHRLRRDLED